MDWRNAKLNWLILIVKQSLNKEKVEGKPIEKLHNFKKLAGKNHGKVFMRNYKKVLKKQK